MCSLWILCVIWVPVDCQKVLRLLGLQPLTGQGWTGGQPCLVATEMAVEDVNNSSYILPEYRLEYDYVDTMVIY